MRLARKLLATLLLAVALASLAAAGLGLAYVKREAATLPDAAAVRDYRPSTTSRVFAADGTLMGRFAEQDRTLVPLDAIPGIVVQAFVSAEDRNYWDHRGVDPVAVARALVSNARNAGSGRRPVGASTITQQVVKNLLVGDEATLRRKVREAIMALRIDEELGKRRVLELYLNEIYLGEGAYGVAAAADAYFGKPIAELGVAEAAFLAGLPKAPSNYHPVRRAEAAAARRAYVVGRMLEDGVIDAAQAAEAVAAPLPRPTRRAMGGPADGYFAEEARRELLARYGSQAVYRGGLSVRTSMDPALQEVAEKALRDGLAAYDRRRGWRGPVARLTPGTLLADPASWRAALSAVEAPPGLGDWRLALVLSAGRDATLGFADGATGTLPLAGLRWARPATARGLGAAPREARDILRPGDVVAVEEVRDPAPGRLELRQLPEVEGSLVAVEARTGRVLAMAGGFSHERSSFNRATQARRQPGSAFKPFVYLSALEAGFDPTSPVLDAPIAIDVGPGLERWRPENYKGSGDGLVTLRHALEKSKNLSTVRLLYEVGLEPVGDVSRRFGIYDKIPNYSAGLGAVEVTNLQLTTAYAMLANGGHRLRPSIVDGIDGPDGRPIYRREEAALDEASRVADPFLVAQLTSVLHGVVKRGTAASALSRIEFPIAGKTGTTNDSIDAWFVGFTPEIAVGVHVGFDQPRDLGGQETGGHTAAPIFGAFVRQANAIRPTDAKVFPLPPGAVRAVVDPVTGDILPKGAPGGVEEVVRDPAARQEAAAGGAKAIRGKGALGATAP